MSDDAMEAAVMGRPYSEKELREELDAARAELAEAQKLIYVPGLWRCPRCDFTLAQSNLNALDGSVTARDEPGDKCPNCGGPLWRVTERQAGNDMIDRAEVMLKELAEARAEIARLRTPPEGAMEAATELAYRVIRLHGQEYISEIARAITAIRRREREKYRAVVEAARAIVDSWRRKEEPAYGMNQLESELYSALAALD